MNIKALKNLIAEVRREQVNEFRKYPDEEKPSNLKIGEDAMTSYLGKKQDNTTGEFERSAHDDEYEPSLTAEEKAQLYDAMMQNVKIVLEKWKERDPNTMAGRYFHDLLHLVKSYDPHWFPANSNDFEAQPFDPRQNY
jgi:hypothetical protein